MKVLQQKRPPPPKSRCRCCWMLDSGGGGVTRLLEIDLEERVLSVEVEVEVLQR